MFVKEAGHVVAEKPLVFFVVIAKSLALSLLATLANVLNQFLVSGFAGHTSL